MNARAVRAPMRDERGKAIEQSEQIFLSRQLIAGYLAFWPFGEDTNIPAGESRKIDVPLPLVPGAI